MHSCTALYATAATGKQLPPSSVCPQARSDAFGRRIHQQVIALSRIFGNVYVTATKSGKLQKLLPKNEIEPYVNKSCFALIICSWGAQTNPELYHEKFSMKALMSPSVH
jgi:hypothetical protein